MCALYANISKVNICTAAKKSLFFVILRGLWHGPLLNITLRKIMTVHLHEPNDLPHVGKTCCKKQDGKASLLQSSHFRVSLKPRISAGQPLPGNFQGVADVIETKKFGLCRNLEAKVGVRMTAPFLVGSSVDIPTPILSQMFPRTLRRCSLPWYALIIGNQLPNRTCLFLNPSSSTGNPFLWVSADLLSAMLKWFKNIFQAVFSYPWSSMIAADKALIWLLTLKYCKMSLKKSSRGSRVLEIYVEQQCTYMSSPGLLPSVPQGSVRWLSALEDATISL